MPIARRLPKRGFVSKKSKVTSEIRLSDLNLVGTKEVTLDVLKKTGLLSHRVAHVKIIAAGKLNNKVKIEQGPNVRITKGAREAIENEGGTIRQVEKIGEKREAK